MVTTIATKDSSQVIVNDSWTTQTTSTKRDVTTSDDYHNATGFVILSPVVDLLEELVKLGLRINFSLCRFIL